MRRIRMIIEYDGTNYSGWQRQLNAPSVQETVENALRRLTGERELFIVGASRTDAGVHAAGQNAHFDTECRVPADKFAFALNTMLPPDVRVRASMPAAEDFHARFSAKGKEYRYLFYNSPHASAMYRSLTAHVMYPLDAEKMDRGSAAGAGTARFRAVRRQRLGCKGHGPRDRRRARRAPGRLRGDARAWKWLPI